MIRYLYVSFLALAGSALAADNAPAIAGLTYSGDQSAVEALDQSISAAGQDKAKLGALEQDLLALLRRNDLTFTARQTVAQRLGWILAIGGTTAEASAYKPLAAMLLDERESELARLALDPARGEVFDRMLVEAAGKTSGRTRIGILDTLGRHRAAAGVPVAVGLLKDSDPATAAAAARTLGQIADAAAVAALQAQPEPTNAAIGAAKLMAASRTSRAAALALLRDVEEGGVDPVQRASAFRASLDLQPETAAQRIEIALGGGDWTFKQPALEAIRASAAANLVPMLTLRLPAWDNATQAAVIAALGRRHEAAATETIASAVGSADPAIRAAAITALGELPGTAETAAQLAGVIAEGEAADAKLARQSLARLNGPAVDATILTGAEKGAPEVRPAFIEQIALRNIAAGRALLARLRQDADRAARMAGAAALGEIGGEPEAKLLLAWSLAATDADEQNRALRSVVNIVLREPASDQRGALVFAAIDQADDATASRLVPALGRLGGKTAADCAARLAIRKDAKAADAALATLARWPDASGIKALATAAEKSPSPAIVGRAIDEALKSIERLRAPWQPGDSAMLGRLLTVATSLPSRQKLVQILGRANDAEALTLLQQARSDATLAVEAAYAAEVVQATLAGPPKIKASPAGGANNLMDGKTSTRWSAPSLGEESIQVDFRQTRGFRQITLDQTARAAEFPEHYEVLVSDDPSAPGKVVASGTGQRNRTVISLPAGTRGRCLIIRNTVERRDTPWTVAELLVD
jgi:HEAT repeat protein